MTILGASQILLKSQVAFVLADTGGRSANNHILEVPKLDTQGNDFVKKYLLCLAVAIYLMAKEMAREGTFALLWVQSVGDNPILRIGFLLSLAALATLTFILSLAIYAALKIVLSVISWPFRATAPRQVGSKKAQLPAAPRDDGIIDAEWTEVD